ncbi:MAG: hypothetical protein P1V81_00495 [Planctomycetota bacterium]|nr:hypothetical protein [Planctomycetota bacterium]
MIRLLALLLVLLALAPPSPAVGEQQNTQVGRLSVVATSPWPNAATKGYQPLQIQAENPSDQPAEVEILVKAGWGNEGMRIERTLRVEPLQRATVEMLVPAYIWNSQEFRLELFSDGDRAYTGSLGSTGSFAMYAHLVAVFSKAGSSSGRGETWSKALSPATTSTTWGQGRWRNLGLHMEKDWSANVSVTVGDVAFEDMSRRWEAYSSLDLAVLDVEGGLPASAELEALFAWVRLGGVVILAGKDANRTLAGVDAVSEWTDSRFALDDVPGAQRYQCGFGRILVVPRSGLLDDARLRDAALGELRQRVRTDWTPSTRGSRGSGEGLRPRVPGIGALPYRAFVALMILFAILVGPVNFFWTKRRGKPAALLFTIPLLALGGALLALGYGFFWQGVDVKTHSDTVALLDQRSGLVSNAEVRAVYAGLAPGQGLLPGQGTGIFPWGTDLMNREDVRYEIRSGPESSYRGGFLPSRLQVRQAILTARGSKLRLQAQFGADSCTLQNGLGVDLEELVVRGHDGAWFELEGRLDAGGTVSLSKLAAPPDLEGLAAFHPEALAVLPRGSYSARTSTSAFRDDCGLELNELSGSHAVLGVLAKGGSR